MWDFTRAGDTFRNRTVVTFDAPAGASTFLDCVGATIASIDLNGAALDPAHAASDGRIELSGLAEHNAVTVEADFAYRTDGQGIHRFVDPEDGEVNFDGITYAKGASVLKQLVYWVGKDLPNALQSETTAGFGHVHDVAILEPYVDEYFAMLRRIYKDKTNEMAANLIEGLYPVCLLYTSPSPRDGLLSR